MGRLVAGRFVIEFSLIELGDDGDPVAEYPQQQVMLMGVQQMAEWLNGLNRRIAELQMTRQNGDLSGRPL